MPEKPIVRCAIHPSVGVARVGNAPADEYYLAPEVPGRAADPPGGYKNAKDRAARRRPGSGSTATSPSRSNRGTSGSCR